MLEQYPAPTSTYRFVPVGLVMLVLSFEVIATAEEEEEEEESCANTVIYE